MIKMAKYLYLLTENYGIILVQQVIVISYINQDFDYEQYLIY